MAKRHESISPKREDQNFLNKDSTRLQIRDVEWPMILIPAWALQSMEIFGLMSLGLSLGMTNAMDADHNASVSAMWNRQSGKHGLMRRGLYWGAGHGITLLAPWWVSGYLLLSLACHCRLPASAEQFLAICFR